MLTVFRRTQWKPLLPFLVPFLMLGSGRAASNPKSDPVVIRVGSQVIHRSEFEAFLATLPMDQAQHPAALARHLGGLLGVADAATRAGIANDPRHRLQLLLNQDQLLGQLYMARMQADIHSSAAQRHAYYQNHLSEFQQRKIRQILITPEQGRNMTQAVALASRLSAELNRTGNSSKAWGRLAKQYSSDLISRPRGGELGWLAFNNLQPPLASRFWGLKPGSARLLRTKSAVRVVEVEAVRTTPYAQVRAWVKAELHSALLQQKRRQLRRQEPIILNPSYFHKFSTALNAASEPALPRHGA